MECLMKKKNKIVEFWSMGGLPKPINHLKKIGISLLMALFLGVTVSAWADIVETTSGYVYKGTITKMDEKEVTIKTATGIARVPRSQVRAFQSEPPPRASGIPVTDPSSQPSPTQKKTASTLGESAKETLRGLKKLEARCEAGISYRDYGPALGEAKFEVNLFLESPEAKKNPELAKAISNAVNHYEAARSVWSNKFGGKYAELEFTPSSPMGRIVLETYPGLNKDVSQGGALHTIQGQTYILIDQAISIIWGEASKELKKATEIYSK